MLRPAERLRTLLPFALAPVLATAQGITPPLAVFQGAQASDAFSSIHSLGQDWVIAGKRSSNASNRFWLTTNGGATWSVIGCPNSTGAHTYFFGQHGPLVFAGTGDTGQACLMRSNDLGLTWSVALDQSQLRALAGSSNVRSVFGPVHVGNGRWLVNLKTLDTSTKVLCSDDNGTTWFAPSAQPGAANGDWARQMQRTSDGTLLWPAVLTDRIYRSTNGGLSWRSSTVPGAQLFQPICDAGNGVYLLGDATTTPNGTIALHRSTDYGKTWSTAHAVNLQRPTTTYWRDILRTDEVLFASACCKEATSNERFMQLHVSWDQGATWSSLGNPYIGPFGGMQAIYQMCRTPRGQVFAACQPDSTILTWWARDGR